MKAYLTRRYHFSASHRLHADALSDAQNRDTYGKCNNPFGHGHNYSVAVTFAGPVDPATGMVCDLADLDAFAREHLLRRNLDTDGWIGNPRGPGDFDSPRIAGVPDFAGPRRRMDLPATSEAIAGCGL